MKNLSMKIVPALFTIILVVANCDKQTNADSTNLSQRISVTTAAVIQSDIIDTVSIFGTIHLRREAHVGSQFDGRLDNFTLLPGDHVYKSQRIALIIPPQREAMLQVLNDLPSDSRSAIEKLTRTIPLVSPIEGVVLEVMRHTGDVVQKGEQIVHLGDLRVLDIRGDLPLQYLPLIRKTDKIDVSFTDYPHKPMRLSLEAISGQINESNQTVMIRLKLENPQNEFRPGMLVKLAFIGSQHNNALIIPRSALLEEEGVYTAFVLKDNKVEQRAVKPGLLQDNQVEILSGVAAGELVVTEKAYSLDDGMEVEVE